MAWPAPPRSAAKRAAPSEDSFTTLDSADSSPEVSSMVASAGSEASFAPTASQTLEMLPALSSSTSPAAVSGWKPSLPKKDSRSRSCVELTFTAPVVPSAPTRSDKTATKPPQVRPLSLSILSERFFSSSSLSPALRRLFLSAAKSSRVILRLMTSLSPDLPSLLPVL